MGAFVQANHGQRRELRVDGYPVGRVLQDLPSPFGEQDTPGMGSIVVVLATDAPLLPHQCQRLAQRASLGIARTGADYNRRDLPRTAQVDMVNNDHISPLFAAAAEAVEEAIINALLAGRPMRAGDGREVPALEGKSLVEALAGMGWKARSVS